MVLMSDTMKLLICIVFDIADFTVGRILGAGIIMDLVAAALAVILFGPVGLVALWEVADPTEQVDGFVPTLTLIALSQLGKSKKKKPAESIEDVDGSIDAQIAQEAARR